MRIRSISRRSATQIALCFLIAACVTAGLAFRSASSAETIAGEYVWLETARAQNDARQAWCDANFAGNDCVELCMRNGGSTVGMNKYCCLNPSKIGGWDNPEECEGAWIPSDVQ